MTGAALVPAVRLFAGLLLRELDDARLAELRATDVAAALRAVGVRPPEARCLEDLRAEYVETFVHPKHGAPPVGSLWVDGQYEGDSTVALRRIARAAGYEFDRDAAMGAAVDHAGSLLLLWCACHETHSDLAELLAAEHLAWIPRALAQPSAGEGFYAEVCRAVVALVGELTGRSPPRW